jgi:DNA-binding transcriptional LysR family regulator
MYFTDRGIEELEDRRGEDEVTMTWLAERLRDFVDLNPDFEVAIDRLASWLARLDNEEDLLFRTSRGPCARPMARLRAVAPVCRVVPPCLVTRLADARDMS